MLLFVFVLWGNSSITRVLVLALELTVSFSLRLLLSISLILFSLSHSLLSLSLSALSLSLSAQTLSQNTGASFAHPELFGYLRVAGGSAAFDVPTAATLLFGGECPLSRMDPSGAVPCASVFIASFGFAPYWSSLTDPQKQQIRLFLFAFKNNALAPVANLAGAVVRTCVCVCVYVRACVMCV